MEFLLLFPSILLHASETSYVHFLAQKFKLNFRGHLNFCAKIRHKNRKLDLNKPENQTGKIQKSHLKKPRKSHLKIPDFLKCKRKIKKKYVKTVTKSRSKTGANSSAVMPIISKAVPSRTHPEDLGHKFLPSWSSNMGK